MVLPPLARFDVRRPVAGAARMGAALRVAVGSGLILALPNVYAFHAALAVAALVAGVALLAPSLGALLPQGTLRARPGLPAGLAVRGLLSFSFFGTEAFVPLASGALRGVTPTRAGLALTTGALGWISASWTQDRLEARGGAGGRARRVAVGFVLLAAGIALVTAALVSSLPELLVPAGWAIAGAGIGTAYSAGGLICIAAAPPGHEGEVSAQLQLAEALATAAGTGFGGALLATLARAGGTPRQAHAAVFAVTLAVALVGAGVAPRAKS
jgi:hypothetical protein